MKIKDIENYFETLDGVENVLKVDCSEPFNTIVSIEQRGTGITQDQIEYFRRSVLPATTKGTIVFYKEYGISYCE